MKRLIWTVLCVIPVAGSIILSRGALAQDGSGADTQLVTAPGDPVLEEPTLHCLGAYWIIPGDDKKEWRVDMEYRKAGEEAWKKSMPMFRVRKGDTTQLTHEAELNPPNDAWLFAGSIVNLMPGTEYELKLKLVKPDGSVTEKLLKARTNTEPTDPPNPRVCHVVPGEVRDFLVGQEERVSEGDGSEANPYKGLYYAESQAQPGTIFLLHKGAYAAGTFHVSRSGTPGRPVIWRGAGDGEAIIVGDGTGKGIEAVRVAQVRFEKLSIKGFNLGIAVTDSSDLVVRRCNISQVKCGIYCSSSDGKVRLHNILICDNVLEGPFTWGEGAAGAGVEEWRGIQVTGSGYDVCYNRVRNFKDGIDTFPSKYCSAIDIHHNEVMGSKDDGCEMDFSERNTRCFLNRFTNINQGVSEQPIFGGPTYIFRNVLYNINGEPFKLHHNGGPGSRVDWWPSGAIMYHNTVVKMGDPDIVSTSAPVYNCVYRNNLFIGGGKRAMNFDPPMVDCDFDYDGFGGGPWEIFMKWNNVRYTTFDEAKAKAPVEKHTVLVVGATAFASGLQRPDTLQTEYAPTVADLRLKAGCAAIDAGEVLPGFNDGFAGKAPDLGAYEVGEGLPHYGPRPEAQPASGR